MPSEEKVFAAILAGGSGKRMGNSERPKQYLMLGSKPILAHTVEKFCVSNTFEAVLVLCPKAWIQQTRDLLNKYCPEYAGMVQVVAGGATRNNTVKEAVAYVQANYQVNEQTILVTHDAVRPFVSQRIIAENIEAVRQHGACDTVIPATDTIVQSEDAQCISAIPDRNLLYQGQTPQSFRLLELKELMDSLTTEEEMILTDACKIYVLRNKKVALVRGAASNMKITYPQDMRVAASLIGE